ncbi:hypothetical protein F4778DRAFT_783562 [Xylariomycetidae sp. FL2044]|nr:hypothetical protein F4778DRAFT_783562 [Xylariomycetidae sp. FL2044]
MSWTLSGDHWRRPLDCHEVMFQSIAAAGQPLGREHWLMAGTLKLLFPYPSSVMEQRLRAAWAALRVRLPDVALELHHDEKRYHPVVSAASLADWVSATFRVEGDVATADDLFSRHLRVANASATCHWVPASQELMPVSSHYRWDGRGLMMVLHEFMNTLAAAEMPPETPDGSEACSLVPSIDEVVGAAQPLSEDLMQQARDLLAPMLQGPPSIGLPTLQGALPGDTRRREAVMPRQATEELRAACRARRIRVTTALHASIVQETTRCHNNANTAGASYKSWAALDLRAYCPKPGNGSSHAPSLRMVALPLVVDAEADWDSLTSAIEPVYTQSFSPSENDMLYVRVPYVEQATSMLATASPTTEPNLSNLGVADDYIRTQYGDVEVAKVCLAIQMLSPQLYVHTWSWKGELIVNICYNEAFYDEGFVKEWWRKVEANLEANLGLTHTLH